MTTRSLRGPDWLNFFIANFGQEHEADVFEGALQRFGGGCIGSSFELEIVDDAFADPRGDRQLRQRP